MVIYAKVVTTHLASLQKVRVLPKVMSDGYIAPASSNSSSYFLISSYS